MGRVKAVAVGDFRRSSGRGHLLERAGLRLQELIHHEHQATPRAEPYTSVNENLFLRGGGATIDLGGN